jgi:hypothetical protein
MSMDTNAGHTDGKLDQYLPEFYHKMCNFGKFFYVMTLLS